MIYESLTYSDPVDQRYDPPLIFDSPDPPAFAAVSRDGVRLLLSGEGSSGKRPLADDRRQVPGGWNRIHLQVSDLASEVERLREAGVPFRTNGIVAGPGGAQIIIDDPSGNPIELFQPHR